MAIGEGVVGVSKWFLVLVGVILVVVGAGLFLVAVGGAAIDWWHAMFQTHWPWLLQMAGAALVADIANNRPPDWYAQHRYAQHRYAQHRYA